MSERSDEVRIIEIRDRIDTSENRYDLRVRSFSMNIDVRGFDIRISLESGVILYILTRRECFIGSSRHRERIIFLIPDTDLLLLFFQGEDRLSGA